jgi:hypothetical protein
MPEFCRDMSALSVKGSKGILEQRPVMLLGPLSLATFLPEAASQVSENN